MSDIKEVSKLMVDSAMINFLGKQADAQNSRSGVWKWVIGVVVSLVAAGAAAWLYRKFTKDGRELAKLKHEKDKAVEKQHALHLKLDLEENDAEIDSLIDKINQLDIKEELIDKQIAELEKLKLAKELQIDAIENWTQINEYIDNINRIVLGKFPDGSSGSDRPN